MSGQALDGLTCPSCGVSNRSGRRFCAECGGSLAVLCAACGAANEPGERFCGDCGAPLVADAATRREAPAAGAGIERRLVSVLFADLVGHTALAEHRDVEDVRELLSRYFELAQTLVERYGGEIEKFIGDAVMAVWGTPTAREDDAERAVRAALELVSEVASLGTGDGAPTLAARAAVLTGEAAVALEARGQGMVAGDLVNTASRVQAIAQPGTVLVGAATRRATEASIAYADAGEHELKGKAEPLPLWQALRVTAGRGGGLKSNTLEPPFVGRERELHLLKELFHANAEERKAHLVSIVGIAGIGKSRLAWELQKYLDGVAQTVYWHRGRCLAYGEGVSYWALAEMVRMRAEIAEGEEPEAALSKLRAALERYVPERDERDWIEPRLAQLLSLDAHESGERPDLFAGWRLFFERLTVHGPVVLAFEDMQWADGPLLEFLEYLLDWSRNHPLFVVALARPELAARHPQWASGTRSSTNLSLEPLSVDAMEALLDGFVPGLPDELRRQVLDRAEGVPLYAVETVRMLLDRGFLEQHAGAYWTTGPIEALEVPETLHALLAARLDALAGDERQLIQDASVVGKTFARSTLAAVASIPEDEVDRVLTALVRKEILSLQEDPRSPERGQYGFLQDLLRQVAYETMPRGERKIRHLGAAAQLEQEWVDGEQETVEIVAFHYLTALELDSTAADAAGIGMKARATLVKAGERAASLAGNESAQRYFEQALELADSPLERAELHERAGRMAMLGLRTVEARAHYERAIATFEEIGLTHPAARVTAKLGILTWHQENDIERAIVDLERSLSVLADEEHDADLGLLAVQLGRLLFFSGRVDDALAQTELALEIAEALRLPEVISHGLNTKSLILSARGRHEEAELLMRHSLETALIHDLSDPALRSYVNLTATVFGWDRYREALDLSREGAELAHKVGDRAGILDAWGRGILFGLGEWDEALATVDSADDEWTRYLMADIALRRGEREEVDRLTSAIKESVDMNEVQGRAQLREFEAMVFLVDGRPREALAAAEAALADRAALLTLNVVGPLAAALEASFALRDDAKIDELMAIVEKLPPGELTPSLRGIGARFSARRAALRGDPETATAGFLAAGAIFQEIETPFDLAVVRLEHAEWLAGEGRLDEAEPLLEEAREIFERLRAAPWLERIDQVAAVAPQPATVE
jgi:class 3 adenylate cyclase/tetratricopeptide (TPR) repeat protein